MNVTYTKVDLENANKFAHHRRLLIMLHKLYEKYPFITSHLQVDVRKAVSGDTDYFYPPELESDAIVVEAKITKRVCEAISCNSASTTGPCRKSDEASYYRVGEGEHFEMQCNPACFHLFTTSVHNETSGGDTEDKPQNIRYRWSELTHTCDIVPAAATWLEQPYYRSNEKYTPRLNDLDTGFDYDPATDSYNFNKYYCDVYYESFDPETRKCYTAWYDKLANIIVGDAIIKLVKAGVTYAENGNGKSLPPLDKPPPPPIDKSKWSVAGWKSNIDESFNLPPVDVTIDGLVKSFDGTDRHRPRRDTPRPPPPPPPPPVPSSDADSSPSSRRERQSKIERLIESLLAELTSQEFYATIAVDVSVTQLATTLKNLIADILEKFLPKLTNTLARTALELSEAVFMNSLNVSMQMLIVPLSVKSVGVVGKFLASTLTLASSGAGIVLMIAQIFSIVLTFWDPLGFNNIVSDDYLDNLYQSSKSALRSTLNTNTPILTFDYICAFLLTESEIIDATIQSYKYVYRYLDALTVNSDGAKITDKTKATLKVSDLNVNRLVTVARLTTTREFEDYESDHMKRRMAFDSLKRYASIAILAGTALVMFKIYLLGVLVFMLSVTLISVSYANVQFGVWKWWHVKTGSLISFGV